MDSLDFRVKIRVIPLVRKVTVERVHPLGTMTLRGSRLNQACHLIALLSDKLL